jgi:hypothetical protein
MSAYATVRVFQPMRDADRLLIAAFIIVCMALSLAFVAGERWIFASSIVFAVLPLGCVLIGVRVNERDRSEAGPR